MAKASKKDGIYVDKPAADIYMVMLIMTFGALLVATVIMWYEKSLLG